MISVRSQEAKGEAPAFKLDGAAKAAATAGRSRRQQAGSLQACAILYICNPAARRPGAALGAHDGSILVRPTWWRGPPAQGGCHCSRAYCRTMAGGVAASPREGHSLLRCTCPPLRRSKAGGAVGRQGIRCSSTTSLRLQRRPPLTTRTFLGAAAVAQVVARCLAGRGHQWQAGPTN
jgi:hypothetical protein